MAINGHRPANGCPPPVVIEPRPNGETIVSVGADAVTVPATGRFEIEVPPAIPPVVMAIMAREPLFSRPELRRRFAVELAEAEALIARGAQQPRPVRVRYAEMTDHGLYALVETARVRGVVVELERG